MGMKTGELRMKDVISAKDGRMLGYICDYEIDTTCGRVEAVFVSQNVGLFGVFCPAEEVRIPWDRIQCIGEDVILVNPGECCPSCGSGDRRKKKWSSFFKG